MVFGPGSEDGQFADMSEPAGRRRRLLFHLQELKYVNKRRSETHYLNWAQNRPENKGHEVVSLVPHPEQLHFGFYAWSETDCRENTCNFAIFLAGGGEILSLYSAEDLFFTRMKKKKP